MSLHLIPTVARSAGVLLIALVTVACGGAEAPALQGQLSQPLTVQPRCVEPGHSAPAGAWVCPSRLTMECNAQRQVELYVQHPVLSCDQLELSLSRSEFPGVGSYEVQVLALFDDVVGPTQLCTAELDVVDSQPPRAEPQPSPVLWPPNHSMWRIGIADCVRISDGCDDDVRASFVWASSDEPADAKGSGNSSPDIEFSGCDAVLLRAERQGGGDGRVYTLGWVAEDASGNLAQGSCTVLVPHDQGGQPAVDSGEAYRELTSAACRN